MLFLNDDREGKDIVMQRKRDGEPLSHCLSIWN